jgi:hypothetical protein
MSRYHQIMHRSATSCESKLSYLNVHNRKMRDELRRDILREDYAEPDIKAGFEKDVAEALARYP